jgi:hypothetical protein
VDKKINAAQLLLGEGSPYKDDFGKEFCKCIKKKHKLKDPRD